MEVAAYAALVSLMNLVEQVQRYAIRRSLPISIDNVKEITFSSLHKTITFLIDFLESDSGSEVFENTAYLCLNTQIAESAYAAQDIIDSHMLEYVVSSSNTMLSFPGIQKVVEEMDSIKERAMKITRGTRSENKKHLQQLSSPSPMIDQYGSTYKIPFQMDVHEKELKQIMAWLTESTARCKSITGVVPFWMDAMVGREEELIQIMERLTDSTARRQVISITGMGGIGKTTLAKNAYEAPLIVHYFDVRVWVSMYQGYSFREILLGAVLCLENTGTYKDLAIFSNDNHSQMDDEQLGDILHKSLCGMRYLVVVDDLWNIDAWDSIRSYFPCDANGSRIIVTTRLSSVATYVDSYPQIIGFLDENDSWNLFCRKVFARETCPLELEEVGRRIVKNCKGLPLGIVAVGGVLLDSPRTEEHWECVARETNSRLSAEGQEHCMDILALSYHKLPLHLKPCFLYMGVFLEDKEIHTASLIDLWIGEGFLKPTISRYMEAVGEEYLNDIISRNLISVKKRGSDGKPKSCNMHPLLRELCLREAHKEKLFYVANVNSPNTMQGCISSHYRITLHRGSSKGESIHRGLNTISLGSQARSLICDLDGDLPLKEFKLLKVLKVADKYTHDGDGTENRYLIDDVFQLLNSRYIAFRAVENSFFPSSFGLLWTLQILIIDEVRFVAPLDIWEMTELRHLEFRSGLYLPDPKMDMQDDGVMTNLRTLMRVDSFRCSDEVLKRIPNIQKLNIFYENDTGGFNNYYLQNLWHLEKLESLSCNFYVPQNWTKTFLTFPVSLKKLTLVGCEFEYIIGSLPHLEVLKLKNISFRGFKWNPVEEEFCQLKLLLVDNCDLVHWYAECTHFPSLEHLVFRSLHRLVKIPSGIGEITSLKSIQLDYCSDSAVISAQEILEEKLSLGYVDFQVRVKIQQQHD